MKASELRIGNFVKGKETNVYWTVEAVDSNSIFSYGKWRPLDAFEPIPITEEWLLNFGFSTTDYKKGYIGIYHKAGGIITDFVLTYPLVNGVFQKHFIWEHSKFKYQELKHVHSLQNLYHALTGEELTLKNTHND